MRVIAGTHRGRVISAPKGERTRPTSDRVRESLFSSLTSLLGADLGGGAALDAFAGSGALGIEALSRGCSSATFVENDRAAMKVLRANLGSLGVEKRCRIVAGDVLSLAASCSVPGGPFALLLLDPPYRLAWADIEGLTSALAGCGLLVDGAAIVYEHASGRPGEWRSEFELEARKRYGTTEVDIVIHRRGRGSS